MTRKLATWTAGLLLLLSACQAAPKTDFARLEAPKGDYDYPFVSPYVATVIGTPPAYRAPLPAEVPVEEFALRVFEDRKVPEVFWYQDGLQIALSAQDTRAPLIFIIAGTGADYDALLMTVLARAFYVSGYHVISLPSPTHPNFIVTASETGVPGRASDDAEDLYRAMQVAYRRVRKYIEVSEFYLTGYSLGGWQAAFVSKLDEAERVFDFNKVLMINPPVSLYSSIKILDALLAEYIPGGIDNVNAFFDQAFDAFAAIYKEDHFVDFTDDFLYRAYTKLEPSEDQLAAVIGLTFRMASLNLIFAADVMTNAGYLVPKNRHLTATSSLTDYFKVGARTSFEDYLNELYYPYFKARDPALTREALIEEGSLRSIEPYLARSDKIGLLTNEDDIILAEGELEYLEHLFGDRAVIFPTGGHCGNLEDAHVLAAVVDFFEQ